MFLVEARSICMLSQLPATYISKDHFVQSQVENIAVQSWNEYISPKEMITLLVDLWSQFNNFVGV